VLPPLPPPSNQVVLPPCSNGRGHIVRAAGDACQHQGSELDFAGFGAGLAQDDVELAARAEPRDRHAVASDVYSFPPPWPARRRRAPSDRATSRSCPGCAAASCRSRSDGAHREHAPVADELDALVEAGADIQLLERTRLRFVDAATQRVIGQGVGLDLVERHGPGDQATDGIGVGLADARTLSDREQRSDRGKLGRTFEDRPLRRVGQRVTRLLAARRTPVPAPLAERLDRLGLGGIPFGAWRAARGPSRRSGFSKPGASSMRRRSGRHRSRRRDTRSASRCAIPDPGANSKSAKTLAQAGGKAMRGASGAH
jgi:hypothetical protein